jgi:hypothetical protein
MMNRPLGASLAMTLSRLYGERQRAPSSAELTDFEAD